MSIFLKLVSAHDSSFCFRGRVLTGVLFSLSLTLILLEKANFGLRGVQYPFLGRLSLNFLDERANVAAEPGVAFTLRHLAKGVLEIARFFRELGVSEQTSEPGFLPLLDG